MTDKELIEISSREWKEGYVTEKEIIKGKEKNELMKEWEKEIHS